MFNAECSYLFISPWTLCPLWLGGEKSVSDIFGHRFSDLLMPPRCKITWRTWRTLDKCGNRNELRLCTNLAGPHPELGGLGEACQTGRTLRAVGSGCGNFSGHPGSTQPPSHRVYPGRRSGSRYGDRRRLDQAWSPYGDASGASGLRNPREKTAFSTPPGKIATPAVADPPPCGPGAIYPIR